MSRDGIMLLGGGGFIGSALAKRLQREGAPVHLVGRHDGSRLAHVLPQCGTVVHLASATTPGSSAAHPCLELDNLALTLRLLDLIQAQPATHLIFFSSGGTVYGNPQQRPVAEDSPLLPLSHYGAGKVAQEMFCQAFRAQGHAVTVLRPSNAYGPGQTLRHGFGLIRTLLEHAHLGTPLEIWGDGESVRDFIYIDDVVEASVRLINQSEDSGTYNLGSSKGYSINQVKGVVEKVCGKALKTIYRPARGMDVRSVVLDNSCLTAQLGWQPSIELEVGVACTWAGLQQSRTDHS